MGEIDEKDGKELGAYATGPMPVEIAFDEDKNEIIVGILDDHVGGDFDKWVEHYYPGATVRFDVPESVERSEAARQEATREARRIESIQGEIARIDRRMAEIRGTGRYAGEAYGLKREKEALEEQLGG